MPVPAKVPFTLAVAALVAGFASAPAVAQTLSERVAGNGHGHVPVFELAVPVDKASAKAPMGATPLMMAEGLVKVQSLGVPLMQPTALSTAAAVDPAVVAQILSSTSVAAPVVTASVTAPAAPATPEEARKVELYKQLMELNGTSANVRMILKNTKESIRMVVIERAGTVTLTPEQEVRYDAAASDILIQTESTLIDDIASAQSKAFTAAEIEALIKANSTPAARKYNASKYVAPNEAVGQIQSYMVDAVYRIIKTYKQVISS